MSGDRERAADGRRGKEEEGQEQEEKEEEEASLAKQAEGIKPEHKGLLQLTPQGSCVRKAAELLIDDPSGHHAIRLDGLNTGVCLA